MMREVFRRRFKGTGKAVQPAADGYGSLPPCGGGLGRGGHPLAKSGGEPPPPNLPPQGGEEHVAPDASFPDLVLIDGGLGQLHAVQQALKDIGVQGPTLVAIAKGEDRNAGREWFHMEGRAPFQLPVNDPLLHYLQRLRDEAHRFAIGRHRKKRSAALTTSVLDDIPGIGSIRKRALLQHFGSRADVERATLGELENVTGISKATARSIYNYFHG